MKKILTKYALTINFLIIAFLTQSAYSYEYPLSLKELSCYSSDPGFSTNDQGYFISPTGKYMAIITTPKENKCDIEENKDLYVEKDMQRAGITLVDLDTMEQRMLSDGSSEESISMFRWVSDDRFLYRNDPFQKKGKKISSLAVFGVNVDGSNRKKLLDYKIGAEGLRGFDIYDMNYSDPDTIFAYWNDRRARVSDYYEINVKTGAYKLLAFGPDIDNKEVIWASYEDAEGYPVAVLTDIGIERVLYTYNKETKEWSEHYRYTCQNPNFTPLALYGEEWLVTGQNIYEEKPGDTNALYLYNPETKTFSEKLYEDERYDIGGYTGGCRGATGGAMVDRVTKELQAVFYVSHKPERIFFDDDAGKLYKAVEQVFPDDFVRIVTSNTQKTRAVISVSNWNNPGDHYYLDIEKGTLQPLWKVRPWLDRSKLAKTKHIIYPARDGLQISAYLTERTFDAGGNYFVILPHGGPNVKQRIGFDPWVQFFASRGFNVLQPDYRGSTGYGRNHYVIGNKQWGKTMQDDLTDGVKWAVDNGYANKSQVCIAGASYGGYAAMAGAVFTPELYSCVINFVGVSDMRDLLSGFGSKSSRFNTWEDEGRLEWGDDQGDEGQKYIQEISPLLHVQNITAPVLISHGANDYIVPIEHARRLKSEMDRLDKEYVYHVEAVEGHGFFGELAKMEHFQVQQDFLEKYVTKKN